MPTHDISSRVTLRDIAAETGVSLTTVSRVLSGSDHRTAEETRERVRAAATRLGYVSRERPSARKTSIAVIAPDLIHPATSAIVNGILVAARDEGLPVTVEFWPDSPEIDPRKIREVVARGHSSIILIGSPPDERISFDAVVAELRAAEAANTRIVHVGSACLNVDTVDIDAESAFSALVSELVRRGNRHVALLTGPQRLRETRLIVSAVRLRLAEHGLALLDSAVIAAAMSRDGGYAAAGELLRRHVDVDVVMSVDDLMTLGAIARVREAGSATLDAFSWTGYGDVPPLRDAEPALTTVRVTTDRVGAEAFAMARRRGAVPRTVRPPWALVMRESTPLRGDAPRGSSELAALP